jgi:hypothetical protein
MRGVEGRKERQARRRAHAREEPGRRVESSAGSGECRRGTGPGRLFAEGEQRSTVREERPARTGGEEGGVGWEAREWW